MNEPIEPNIAGAGTPSQTKSGASRVFISYSLDVAPEVDALLGDMAAESGDSKEDVIRKAIGLYKLALDAHREGLRVGAVQPEQDMEVEFILPGATAHAR